MSCHLYFRYSKEPLLSLAKTTIELYLSGLLCASHDHIKTLEMRENLVEMTQPAAYVLLVSANLHLDFPAVKLGKLPAFFFFP